MTVTGCRGVADLRHCEDHAIRLHRRRRTCDGLWVRLVLSCRPDELEAEALLLGLLCEPECRAAVMLARVAVDRPLVRRAMAQLGIRSPLARGRFCRPNRFSTEVELSLRLATDRLTWLPQPLELATEHILLGLAAADHEVAVWLRQRGVDPDQLEAEIRKLYGCQSGR